MQAAALSWMQVSSARNDGACGAAGGAGGAGGDIGRGNLAGAVAVAPDFAAGAHAPWSAAEWAWDPVSMVRGRAARRGAARERTLK